MCFGVHADFSVCAPQIIIVFFVTYQSRTRNYRLRSKSLGYLRMALEYTFAMCIMIAMALLSSDSSRISFGYRMTVGGFIFFPICTLRGNDDLIRSERSGYNTWVRSRTELRTAQASQKRLRVRLQTLNQSLLAAQEIVDRNVMEGGAALAAYKIRHSDLTIGVQLGEGSYGTVYHGTFHGNECAVKTVRTTKVTDAIVQKFLGELMLMAPLRHPNLVGLVGGCWTDGPDKLCIVLEYCPKGSLDGMLKDRGNTWEAHYYEISLGVAQCFNYLHHEQPGEPLIHRDLKPDNVLIAGDGTAKVADFGESTRFDDIRAAEEDDRALTMTIVGTPMYCAPEILDGNRYNTSVDVQVVKQLFLSNLIEL